jgi:putative endonuclease
MTNKNNKVLYIGVTNNIIRRISEHKTKINTGFTKKYNCNKLVYYEISNSMITAIEREKQLKNWKRCWKDELVKSFNPRWLDLSQNIGVTEEVVMEFAEQNCKR